MDGELFEEELKVSTGCKSEKNRGEKKQNLLL